MENNLKAIGSEGHVYNKGARRIFMPCTYVLISNLFSVSCVCQAKHDKQRIRASSDTISVNDWSGWKVLPVSFLILSYIGEGGTPSFNNSMYSLVQLSIEVLERIDHM